MWWTTQTTCATWWTCPEGTEQKILFINTLYLSLILYLLFRMPMNMKQINKNLADGLGQALDEHVVDKLVVSHVQDTGHLLGVAVSEG